MQNNAQNGEKGSFLWVLGKNDTMAGNCNRKKYMNSQKENLLPTKNFKPCTICLSAFRKTMESDYRKKIKGRVILDRYGKHFGCSREVLRAKLHNHMAKHMEYATTMIMLNTQNGAINQESIESFAQKLLNLGGIMLEAEPWKFQPKDIIAAQDLILKKRQLQFQENAMQTSIARLFGRIGLKELPFEEGEVVENEPATKTDRADSGEVRTSTA